MPLAPRKSASRLAAAPEAVSEPWTHHEDEELPAPTLHDAAKGDEKLHMGPAVSPALLQLLQNLQSSLRDEAGWREQAQAVSAGHAFALERVHLEASRMRSLLGLTTGSTNGSAVFESGVLSPALLTQPYSPKSPLSPKAAAPKFDMKSFNGNLTTALALVSSTGNVNGAEEAEQEREDKAEAAYVDAHQYNQRLLQRWTDLSFRLMLLNAATERGINFDGDTSYADGEMTEGKLEDLLHRKSFSNVGKPKRSSGFLGRLVTRPLSKRRLCWEVAGFLLIIYDLVTFPLGAFDPPETDFGFVMQFVAPVFWSLDLPSQFFLGFNHPEGYLEMRVPRTARKYLYSWFPFDFLVVTLDISFLIAGSSGPTALLRLLRVVRALRLLRLSAKLDTVKHLLETIDSEGILLVLRVVKLLSFLLIANHYWCALWYLLGNSVAEGAGPSWLNFYDMHEKTLSFRYLTSLHWSVTQFTPASMEVTPKNSLERVFTIFTVLVGMVGFSSFVSNITNTMHEIRNFDAAKQKEKHLLRRFLGRHHVSTQLSQRVWTFIGQHQVNDNVTEGEVKLIKDLPHSLQIELHNEMYLPSLAEHPIFTALANESMPVVSQLCHEALKQSSVANHHDLFLKGHVGSHMYFVYNGALRYSEVLDVDYNRKKRSSLSNTSSMTSTERTRTMDDFARNGGILVSGDWACEATLWVEKWTHRGWAVAVMETELNHLDAAKFFGIVKHLKAVHRYARDFRSLVERGVVGDVYLEMPTIEELVTDAFPTQEQRSNEEEVKRQFMRSGSSGKGAQTLLSLFR